MLKIIIEVSLTWLPNKSIVIWGQYECIFRLLQATISWYSVTVYHLGILAIFNLEKCEDILGMSIAFIIISSKDKLDSEDDENINTLNDFFRC